MNQSFKHLASLTLLIIGLAILSLPAQAQFFSKKKPDLLPEEQAFIVTADILGDRLTINWSIAPDYYMYRDQFSVSANDASVEIGELQFPKGEIEDDPEFGQVEVYFFNAELSALINASASKTKQLELTLKGQGCNKPIGICYPPQTRLVTVALSEQTGAPQALAPENTPQKDKVVGSGRSFWSYLLAAFGAGILLSFTPCVLPMIPILAGVIAKEHAPSKMRSGWLACCYVGGTIVTYMIAGWVAGATGAQLQAYFQSPWIIGFICALLILLAASLFGWFKIELPSSLQSKLNNVEMKNGSAAVSSFALGLMSALVVGACVSPILIVTLGAAITQGDPVLGAGIMGMMAAGMGILLILFGFGAGWILPRTGAWMQQIQVIFGFMVLGVAIYLASTLAATPSLLLWAALLLVTGFYIWNLSHSTSAELGRSMLRAIATITLLWGAMALFGGASGGSDILRPLGSLNFNNGSTTTEHASLPFQTVTSVGAAQVLLDDAKRNKQAVLIDFYADWCLDCKRMQRSTFKQASVASALQAWQLIEVDVTKTNDESQAIKKYFEVFGPPATLFITPEGEELTNLRQYGYLDEAAFLALVANATANH